MIALPKDETKVRVMRVERSDISWHAQNSRYQRERHRRERGRGNGMREVEEIGEMEDGSGESRKEEI